MKAPPPVTHLLQHGCTCLSFLNRDQASIYVSLWEGYAHSNHCRSTKYYRITSVICFPQTLGCPSAPRSCTPLHSSFSPSFLSRKEFPHLIFCCSTSVSCTLPSLSEPRCNSLSVRPSIHQLDPKLHSPTYSGILLQ